MNKTQEEVKYDFTFTPNYNGRSRKVTPFDRHSPKPWYLGKLRYKGYWRSYEVAARGRSQYSTSLALLASYLHSNGIASPGGTFLDAGCGDSPDALLAVRELGYDKAIKVDLFAPTYDEYGVAKYDIAHYHNPDYGHKGIMGRMESLERQARVSFLQGDLCEPLPIGTGAISAISCNAVVDLIKEEDKVAFYKQMYRILSLGACFA